MSERMSDERLAEIEKDLREFRIGNPAALNGPLIEALKAERAEVERLEKQNQWQPIKTAPKDGTKILGFEDGDFYKMSWEGEYWSSYCGQPVVMEPEPTHWMPLPGGAEMTAQEVRL